MLVTSYPKIIGKDISMVKDVHSISFITHKDYKRIITSLHPTPGHSWILDAKVVDELVKKCNAFLAERAEKAGADAVVDVHYSYNSNNYKGNSSINVDSMEGVTMMAYGTAVNVK